MVPSEGAMAPNPTETRTSAISAAQNWYVGIGAGVADDVFESAVWSQC